MDKAQFSQTLHCVTLETLETTRPYLIEALPDEYYYCVLYLPTREVGPILDESGVVETYWSDGRVPEWITVRVGAIEDGRTIFYLTASQNQIAPDSEEWREKWNLTGEPTRTYLPFLLRLPPLPEGWRIVSNGIPDMARSLEEKGKFPLPALLEKHAS